MDIKGILVLIVMLVLLYVLLKYAMAGPTVHTGVTSGLQEQIIKAASISTASTAARTNFAHSIWFYVDDWNYNYGVYKPLIARTTLSADPPDILPGLPMSNACPLVVLGATDNTLDIFQSIFETGGQTSASTVAVGTEKYNRCTLTNLPIQKWCHLVVSFYGRTCDVYLDGKLVKTCVMDGPPKVDKTADVYISPGVQQGKGSFKGWTSDFQYFGDSLNPQQVFDIYKKGFGGNWLSSLLNLEVKVSLSKNGKVEKEYTF